MAHLFVHVHIVPMLLVFLLSVEVDIAQGAPVVPVAVTFVPRKLDAIFKRNVTHFALSNAVHFVSVLDVFRVAVKFYAALDAFSHLRIFAFLPTLPALQAFVAGVALVGEYVGEVF